jgi:hypothetical protein
MGKESVIIYIDVDIDIDIDIYTHMHTHKEMLLVIKRMNFCHLHQRGETEGNYVK